MSAERYEIARQVPPRPARRLVSVLCDRCATGRIPRSAIVITVHEIGRDLVVRYDRQFRVQPGVLGADRGKLDTSHADEPVPDLLPHRMFEGWCARHGQVVVTTNAVRAAVEEAKRKGHEVTIRSEPVP